MTFDEKMRYCRAERLEEALRPVIEETNRKIEAAFAEPGAFRLVTAALIICGLCGRTIDGMGGPGDGPVCIPCGDVVRSGQARGAIKWDANNPDEQGDRRD